MGEFQARGFVFFVPPVWKLSLNYIILPLVDREGEWEWFLLAKANLLKRKKTPPSLCSSNISNKPESILVNAIDYRVLLERVIISYPLFFLILLLKFFVL